MLRVLIPLILSVSTASASIDRFNDKTFTLKFFSESPDLKTKILPFDTSQAISGVEYRPNVGTPSGISLSISDFIGFSYITELNEEKVTDDKGKTSYDDIRLTLAFDKFLISTNFLRYKGFYIENSSEIDPTLPASTSFIRRGDVEMKTYGGQFLWIFNSNDYSLVALLDQTVRQKQDGGSWVAGASVRQFELGGDSALVPSSVQSQFGNEGTLTKGQFTTISALFGYGYTWVWGNFYLGGLLMAGTGHQIRKIETATSDFEDDAQIQRFSARLGLGYNGDRFFVGAHSEADTTTSKVGSIKVQSELLNFQIFLGTRF